MSAHPDEMAALLARPDLKAIGVVFIDPRNLGVTVTLWQYPDRSDPAMLAAHQRRTGQVPGAFVVIFERGIETLLNHDMRPQWLEAYVTNLGRQIAAAGSLEAFLATTIDPRQN